jgi:N-acetylmuramic acid 6-phosphate etherase
MYSEEVIRNAEHFLNNETQFHLGMLPTEQSNPKTRGLDEVFRKSAADGVSMLLSVDRDVVEMAKRIFAGTEFAQMVDAGLKTVLGGGRIVFSGCGATGRLSILLESMWRRFFIDLKASSPEIYAKVAEYDNSVFSIMTGGDYALIRSVESFEDYAQFGKQQARELGISSSDMLVAITEGGETSSVLGTVEYAADMGAEVFLMFNNPADILCKYIERSRRAIEDSRVTVLDLFCGPMAIAGSTRMQATTSEQLIGGAALESILSGVFNKSCTCQDMESLGFRKYDFAADFESLVNELSRSENAEEIGNVVKVEADIYGENGLVTYFADSYLLDIFTDTTERAPTFMLPPFKRSDFPDAPPSWAFVKDPALATVQAWQKVLGREPRCLEWNSALYKDLNAPQNLIDEPPCLGKNDIVKFLIGNETDASRVSREPNVAFMITAGSETSAESFSGFIKSFDEYAKAFNQKRKLIIGQSSQNGDFNINCSPAASPLRLMERLAVKLVLNTLSTGSMVLLGRVASNWMSWVEVSNKKLRDRGIRLICELCDVSYKDACYALHDTINELGKMDFTGKERPSPVQYTIRKIKNNKQ